MFFPISAHFTATLEIPLTSTSLKKISFNGSSWVKPIHFTADLISRLRFLYTQVIPNNARNLRITAAAGT